MLTSRAAGIAAGTASAAAGVSSISGEPRSVAGAALADDTGAGSDGVVGVVGVVGTDSVGVGSDCQDIVAGLPLGQTASLPVVVINIVRCSGVGCGVGCGAGSGSASGGTESDGGGGGRVSIGGGSTTTGGVVTTGDDVVGGGAGSATCFPPLTIVLLSPVSCCCSDDEGRSFAQASLELRIEAKRHKTSATTRARGLRSCRWAPMAVFLCGCPRIKSLRTLPIVIR
jgi:hypothetical protein